MQIRKWRFLWEEMAPPLPASTSPLPIPVRFQALVSCSAAPLQVPSQPHLCSVSRRLCSQTCRCTCMTGGCSGREHQCGSCRSPPHTHPHLAGAEGARETPRQRLPRAPGRGPPRANPPSLPQRGSDSSRSRCPPTPLWFQSGPTAIPGIQKKTHFPQKRLIHNDS